MLALLLLLSVARAKKITFSSGIDAKLTANCSATGAHEVIEVKNTVPGWTSFDNAKWVWVNSTVPETCTITGLKVRVGKNAKAVLQIAADDSVEVFINSKKCNTTKVNASHIEKIDLTRAFNKKNDYSIVFQVDNKDSRGGLAFHLEVEFKENQNKMFWILVGLGSLVGVTVLL